MNDHRAHKPAAASTSKKKSTPRRDAEDTTGASAAVEDDVDDDDEVEGDDELNQATSGRGTNDVGAAGRAKGQRKPQAKTSR
jgi:hypothetical protein